MSSLRQRLPILVAAFTAGALALVAQSLLVREELLLYGGNEVALGSFLSLWLLGIVAGALATRRFRDRAAAAVVPLLLVQGVLPLLAVILARAGRGIAGIPAYEPFPLVALLVWTAPIALPVALTTGALVPAMAARARAAAGSATDITDITIIYVAEAAGSFLGGAGTTLLLTAGVEPATLVLGCSAIAGIGAATVTGRRRPLFGPLVAFAVVAGVVAPLSGPALGDALRSHHLGTILPGSTLLDHLEGPSGSLVLAELNRQHVLLIDGRIVAAFPDPARVERAAGALGAFTAGPKRLLIIGVEAIDVLPGVLTHAVHDEIVWLVPDPGIREFALRHVPGLAADHRLRVLVGDPIRQHDELVEHGPFDAVWLMVDTPLRRSDDRFLSRESLVRLADLLAPDGVLLVPVRSAENYIGPRLRLAVGTVVAGVGAALEHVALVPGEDGLVLGSRDASKIRLDPRDLYAAYEGLQPSRLRLTPEAFAALVEPSRVARAQSLVVSLLDDPNVRPSDLTRPLALFNNLLVRAEQESDDLARLLEALQRNGHVIWVPLVVLALFALANIAARRRRVDTQRRAALVVLAAGGAVGMGLDLLLLHIYQGRFGTLYLEVGWLFGLWMGGLAIGGLVGRKLCATQSYYLVGGVVLLLLAGIAAGLATLGGDALPARLLGAAAFTVAGSLSGALIPVAEAMLARAGVVGATAGIGIEAADHAGGAIAAMALGILGIPILGLGASAWLVAGVACLGAAAIGLAAARERKLFAGVLERWLQHGAAYESFPYRGAIFLALSFATAAVIGHAVVHRVLLGPHIRLDAQVLSNAGVPPPWREVGEPVVHYRSGAGPGGDVTLASRAAAPRVQGYGGPINLIVTSSADGIIRHVAFLEHRETPTYVESADSLFSALEGKSLLAPFSIRARPPGLDTEPALVVGAQAIDAITAATVTSRAVARALEQTGRRLAEPVFGRAYTGGESTAMWRGRWDDPRLLYLAASLLLLLPVFLFGGRRLRRAWLLLQAGIGGVWLGVQLSTIQVLAWLRLDAELNLLAFTGLLAVVVLLAVLIGPLYCGYLCPAGALQELLGIVGGARRMPPELDRPARFIKYVLLAVVVTGAVGLESESVLQIDLLREVWASHRTGVGILLLALIGAGSLLTVRFGCRYLCPTGAFLNLLGKLALLRRFLPEKEYTLCDLGVRGAPDVDCLQCNRCLVGERADVAPAWRQTLFRYGLVTLVVVLAWVALPIGTGSSTAPSVEPQIRAVDVSLLERRQRAGKLAGKRADYWHVVRP